MKTFMPKSGEVERNWQVVDAEGKILGRLATEIANTLRGKNKPNFTPHMDTGDFVVVINAGKISLTGKKLTDKVYYHHTGYPGGIRGITAEKLLEKKPEQLLIEAVKGMLPKNKLQSVFMKKLKVYAGADHPHAAQLPKAASI
ncbi:MAG: 50S ribosomal protein L13 [Proteobacteria bacterium]|nr:50S ribosomal protein L13 [Pseudomonadota bacterium]